MRDLVLASQYKKNGYQVIFAVQNLIGNINQYIIENGYKIEIIKSNKLSEFLKIVKKYKIKEIVIDHYEIDWKYEKSLKDKVDVHLTSFDDIYTRHYCDTIYNHNIYANKKKYSSLVPSNCTLKCGGKYTLLRNEFIKFKRTIPLKNKSIFIAMGGADSHNLNIKILKVLKQVPDININIVTTTANINLNTLKKYIKNKKHIQLHINSTKIASLLSKTSLAIITPSVIANEVSYMNIPFIAIKTADNQKEMYQYLKKKNIKVLKRFNADKLLKKVNKELFNKEEIQIIDFINLTLDEKKMILEWRNHPLIREVMYNKQHIQLKDHLSFIESLNSNLTKKYFLVKENDKYIGVIDFININRKDAELGIYTNPNLKGYGRKLLETLCNYAFKKLHLKKIYAEVYISNIKAIKLYEEFNFITIDTQVRDHNKIYCMELTHENWSI